MKTGKIVEITKKYAIVLDKTMHFERIIKKESMCIGQDIYYTEEDNYMQNEVFGFNIRRNKMAFASLILFLVLLMGAGIYNLRDVSLNHQEVFAYISIDINPSVELGVDQFEKVVTYKALNSDGNYIVSEGLIGLELKVALDMLLGQAREQGYLYDNDSIMITSTKMINNDNSEESISLEQEVEETLDIYMDNKRESYSFIYYKGKIKERIDAEEIGLSLGKYMMLKTYNSLSEEEPLSIEEISQLKVTEIMNLIEKQKDEKQKLKENKLIQYKSNALIEQEENMKQNKGNGTNNNGNNIDNNTNNKGNNTDNNTNNKGNNTDNNTNNNGNNTDNNTNNKGNNTDNNTNNNGNNTDNNTNNNGNNTDNNTNNKGNNTDTNTNNNGNNTDTNTNNKGNNADTNTNNSGNNIDNNTNNSGNETDNGTNSNGNNLDSDINNKSKDWNSNTNKKGNKGSGNK